MKIVNNIKSFIDIIQKVNYILSHKQKKRSVFVFINMIIASILDTLGVAAILPFISALTDIDIVKRQWYTKIFIKLFNIKSDRMLIILIGIGIILIYVIKNIYLYLYQCSLIKFQCDIQNDTSVLMLKSYLSHPYSFFRKTNSSVILRGIDVDAQALYYIINNLFLLMSQILTIVLVGLFLIRQDVVMALGVLLASMVCILLISGFLRSKVSIAGKDFSQSSADKVKCSYQIVNGIKEIFVMQRQELFMSKYEKAYSKYCDSQNTRDRVQAVPVRLIETVFITFIIGIVCIKMALGMDPNNYVPQLATFAVAGFRLIPMVTNVPNCLNVLVFYVPTLNETYENIKTARAYSKDCNIHMIDIIKDTCDNTKLDDSIRICNMCYKYEDSNEYVLKDISLNIKKGDSIGIVGESGAGKSTFADIIMGLQKPSKGKILIDGVDISVVPNRYSRMIGYIPQSIFLLDDTIKNNVLFGEESRGNDDKVWEALDKAHIKAFVESLPERINTVVGEKGVRLSGGQRQRIAIARVMYNDPSIIVMDEATSALDNETEKAIMESVDSMQGSKTLIIVAHRFTTIKNCNKIYEIKNGKLIDRQYSELQ